MTKYIISTLVGIIVLAIASTTTTHATGFEAGRIIDDGIFTDTSSMNTEQIQQFLNSKVPSCDTWGTQSSEFGGGTRRQWAEARGYMAPYTCLKDYVENGKSAAQIIYELSQQYGISPKVLLVLLQKEQGLVTDTWPLSKQYRTATGYGCPDTSVCDSQYYGFNNQVNKAAFMFRAIMNASPTWYTPYVLGNNRIYYNPGPYDNANGRYYGRFGDRADIEYCGSSTVNIVNRATQALYNYTPYQPNQAALNAGYGSAPPCGAYGNRNFYLYFTSWFGSTTAAASYGYSIVSREIYSDGALQNRISDIPTVEPNSTFYVKLVVKNTGNQVWNKETMRIGGQDPQDRWSVFAADTWPSYGRPGGMAETSVGENGTATFTFKMKAPPQLATYQETFGLLIEGNRWLPGSFTIPITVAASGPYYAAQRVSFEAFSDSALSYKLNPASITSYVDSKIYIKAVIKNIGNQPLPITQTRVSTSNPTDRLSNYADSNWISQNRAVGASAAIPAGQSGTFTFSMISSAVRTRAIEQFGLIIEGQQWLHEDIGAVSIETKVRPPLELTTNQAITPGQALLSSDTRFSLIFQGDSNLVLYSPNRPLWSSGTVNSGATKLVMQTDGNLVLYRSNGVPVWSSGTSGRGTSKLIPQVDGNLVLYTSAWQPTWSTATSGQQ